MKAVKEADLDFSAIEAKFKELEPPKITVQEAIERMLPAIRGRIADGITVDQIKEVLDAEGLKIAKTKLVRLIETNSLGSGGAKPMKKAEFSPATATDTLATSPTEVK